MLPLLKNIVKDFTGLFFPAACQACDRTLAAGEELICTRCRLRLPYTDLHLGDPAANPLKNRFSGKMPVGQVLAYLYFRRSGRVQRLLHALKYRGREEVGETLGRWYGHALSAQGFHLNIDLILPVPLHPAKQRQRGYNQSESFARGLAGTLNLPLATQVLARRINTRTQTHKSRYERWQNVEHVFEVLAADHVQDKRVLVVDDVLTTGATLEACGQTLYRAGCRQIHLAVIAAA